MEKVTEAPEQGVIIKETVDGVAVSNPGRTTRGSGGKDVAKPRPDPYIWGIYIMLLMVSVIELFSASSSEVSGSNVYMPLIRHAIFLVIGLGLVLALQNTHYGYFSRFAWFAALISLGLLIFSNFFGVEINGAQRAIRVAGFTIQPPEIVKLTVVGQRILTPPQYIHWNKSQETHLSMEIFQQSHIYLTMVQSFRLLVRLKGKMGIPDPSDPLLQGHNQLTILLREIFRPNISCKPHRKALLYPVLLLSSRFYRSFR